MRLKDIDVAKQIDVEIQTHDDGKMDEVGILVRSLDGKDLTGQQILDAISEALLLHYNNFDMEAPSEYDA